MAENPYIRGLRANVPYAMNPYRYSTVGLNHSGRDMGLLNTEAVTSGITLINTPHGPGLNFDGTADVYRTSYSRPNLTQEETSQLTCATWFRTTYQVVDQTICGVASSGAASLSEWYMQLEAPGGETNCRFKGTNAAGTTVAIQDTVDISDDVWHQFVATAELNADDNLEFHGYLDGIEFGSIIDTGTGWETGSTQPLRVAQRGGGGNEYPFTGDLAGLFVDNRVWHAEEIAALYRAGNHNQIFVRTPPLREPINALLLPPVPQVPSNATYYRRRLGFVG